MPKISLAGFKDPVRRPRYIIWTGVAVLALAAFMITALGVTSTYWFCANGCHKVQDDTIIAYDASSHSEISCMACHMPVNANPVVFLLHKAEALGEAYLTIANKWEFPLNHGSHLSLSDHMPAGQCTQCHNLDNRTVTPGDGIIIDHAAHSDADVACSWCHNRVAHPEDFQDEEGHLTLTHPATGEPNVAHDDFMEMTACFRCHGLEDDANAPGECSKCHPSDFELKPPSHAEGDFYPRGHADMALEDMGMGHEDDAHVEEASHEEAAASEEATHEDEAGSEEETHAEDDADHGEEDAHGDEGGHETYDGPIPDSEGSYAGLGVYLPTVSEISYCGTCHLTEKFCMNCHGMEMPHPEEFKTETHPEVVNTQYEKCVLCHDSDQTTFCDDCHHGDKVAWEFDAAEPWFTQHAKSVVAGGIDSCLEACHDTTFCSDCHTAENPYPSSHEAGDWLHRATYDERAKHPEAGQASDWVACEICHGEGGPEAKFCADCHQFELPHEDEFKERHAATGLKNEAQCAYCHSFGPVCSTCHHFGIQTDFKAAHPASIVEQGTDPCFELCHDKPFCVDCHTTENAVPTSHNPGDFTRKFGEESARHVVAFDESAESCTYCHGDGGTEAKFCNDCHGMEMPHPSGFGAEDEGGAHAENIAGGSMSRTACENCHQVRFCNACHHVDSTAGKDWQTQDHFNVVSDSGAEDCFECHEPTFCAGCHVNLGR